MRTLISFVFVWLVLGPVAAQDAAKLTNQQIVARIIQESRQAYYATGHPCACPDDRARNGSRCGGRSAYTWPGGASPKCFPQDVTVAEIAAYRAQHGR